MQVNVFSDTAVVLPQITQQTLPPTIGGVAHATPVQTVNAVSAVAEGQATKTQTSLSQQPEGSRSNMDERTDSAVKRLNETASLFDTQLQFTIDPATGRRVVKVMDRATNEVIRQIPAEDVLRLSQAIEDFKGLLVREQA